MSAQSQSQPISHQCSDITSLSNTSGETDTDSSTLRISSRSSSGGSAGYNISRVSSLMDSKSGSFGLAAISENEESSSSNFSWERQLQLSEQLSQLDVVTKPKDPRHQTIMDHWLYILLLPFLCMLLRGVIVLGCVYISVFGPAMLILSCEAPSFGALILAASISTFTLAFTLCATAVMVKWVVIGRHKPGKYPINSVYYWRWLFVRSVLNIPQKYVLPIFHGTPVVWSYHCWLGARRLGAMRTRAYCIISTEDLHEVDLIYFPAFPAKVALDRSHAATCASIDISTGHLILQSGPLDTIINKSSISLLAAHTAGSDQPINDDPEYLGKRSYSFTHESEPIFPQIPHCSSTRCTAILIWMAFSAHGVVLGVVMKLWLLLNITDNHMMTILLSVSAIPLSAGILFGLAVVIVQRAFMLPMKSLLPESTAIHGIPLLNLMLTNLQKSPLFKLFSYYLAASCNCVLFMRLMGSTIGKDVVLVSLPYTCHFEDILILDGVRIGSGMTVYTKSPSSSSTSITYKVCFTRGSLIADNTLVFPTEDEGLFVRPPSPRRSAPGSPKKWQWHKSDFSPRRSPPHVPITANHTPSSWEIENQEKARTGHLFEEWNDDDDGVAMESSYTDRANNSLCPELVRMWIWGLYSSVMAFFTISSLWIPAVWWGVEMLNMMEGTLASPVLAHPSRAIGRPVYVLLVLIAGQAMLSLGCMLFALLTKRVLLNYAVMVGKDISLSSWSYLLWAITDNTVAAADDFILSFHRGTAWDCVWLSSLGFDSSRLSYLASSFLSLWMIPRADSHLADASTFLNSKQQSSAIISAVGHSVRCMYLSDKNACFR